MSTHPFVTRVRFERLVVSTVNGARPESVRELSGLGPEEISSWADFLPVALPEASVTRVRRALLDLSSRIRGFSSNSHRGGGWSSHDDVGDLSGDLTWVVGVLGENRSA